MNNVKEYTFNFAKFNNRVPMVDFIDSLSESEQAKLYFYIHKFIEMKNNKIRLHEKFSKHLEDGIYELKVDFENRISRSLYFYELNKEIIFTNGFIKKTNKTPRNEILKAIKIREIYTDNK
jgi:phage-related protein